MSQKSASMGLEATLFVVFVVLKLTGHIDWSWWWVTSPLWISACVALTLIGIALFIAKVLK